MVYKRMKGTDNLFQYFSTLCHILYILYRFFMGGMNNINPINISSIILQTTCTNLGTVIKSLTILDNILSNNLDYHDDIVLDDPQNVLILKRLFSSALSNEDFIRNKYIWAVFKAFVNHKDKIKINFQSE